MAEIERNVEFFQLCSEGKKTMIKANARDNEMMGWSIHTGKVALGDRFLAIPDIQPVRVLMNLDTPDAAAEAAASARAPLPSFMRSDPTAPVPATSQRIDPLAVLREPEPGPMLPEGKSKSTGEGERDDTPTGVRL